MYISQGASQFGGVLKGTSEWIGTTGNFSGNYVIPIIFSGPRVCVSVLDSEFNWVCFTATTYLYRVCCAAALLRYPCCYCGLASFSSNNNTTFFQHHWQ